ncbi:hypothetical protein IF1G_00296 [Cordyceps javanica]|uniref:Uncharacterized protein n=1 Tax=Cordyceps javanica TaxID=43265 RepID=A0A545VF58_9HYPO|nr:hypothetical protein IF1G_00296 [Cordyceps javanica]
MPYYSPSKKSKRFIHKRAQYTVWIEDIHGTQLSWSRVPRHVRRPTTRAGRPLTCMCKSLQRVSGVFPGAHLAGVVYWK